MSKRWFQFAVLIAGLALFGVPGAKANVGSHALAKSVKAVG